MIIELSRSAVLGLARPGYQHEPTHGFCMICGGVWPCWRGASPETSRNPYETELVPRLDTIS